MIIDLILKKLDKDPTIKRHLLKTLSWRALGTLDTIALGWLVTGDIRFGAKIGGLELGTKMLLYFLHERMWNKIKFGLPGRQARARKVQEQIAPTLFAHRSQVGRSQREEASGHRSFTIWLTGLSASGKSSVADELNRILFEAGIRSYVVDGDNTRLGLNKDLSFSQEDRSENIRRVAEVCKLFNDAGVIAIASFISPFAADRTSARSIIGPKSFIEVFADADLATCEQRDTKGLYAQARQGKIKNFTGIDSPYERPTHPDLHLPTGQRPTAECVEMALDYLEWKEYLLPDQKVKAQV